MLPDGRIFFVSFYNESLQPNIWDPVSNTFTPTAAAPYELFCAGHTSLADGRVFIAGGHIADYTGFAHALIYDPDTNTYKSVPDMNEGRWYPTTTVLPNGDVLVTSGDVNANTNVDPLPQVYQMATNSWRNLSTAQLVMQLYPPMFVAPNGKVFFASHTSRYLSTSGTGAWSTVGSTVFGAVRSYGPGIMYDAGKVLLVGGADPPTATAETIDLNAATPAWKSTGSMHFPRRQHNAVILPDGKVFIVGGSSAGGFDTSTSPVLPTEMWDPATGQFTVMASIGVYRGYHSIAMLLPDGRVLSGGGNVGGANGQIYSPPYLFAGGRPTISSAPSAAGYGQSVFIGSPDAASIKQVTFLRLTSTTHTFDESGRFMRLSFTPGTNGLNVTMPANGNMAPPGYYMLFILNGSGVPSVAKIIQVSSAAVTSGGITGTVTNTSGAPLLQASVVVGGSGAVTAADGTYSLQNVAPGTVTVTASRGGYQSASTSATVTAGNTTTVPVIKLAPVGPGTISGSVTTSAGVGVAGATVIAGGLSATTDANGAYTIANVPGGSQVVTASASGFANGTATVTVAAGATTTVPPIVLSSNFGTITGTVKNSAGAAISGATVEYGGGTTTTNATGAYTLTQVPAGPVQLVASATGFQSSTQNLTITGGATTTANFTLTTGTGSGTVTGKITNVSNGAAVANATVSWSGGSTTSNTSGIYTLTGVTSGTQAITAVASGFLAHTLTVAVNAGATSSLDIPIATGGKITVTVVNSSGTAVSGVAVSATGGNIPTTVNGTTGTAGTFTTNWVPTGGYTVSITTSSGTQSSPVTVTSGATAAVKFTAGSTPPGTGTVTGTITSASTGAALSGATVSWSGGSTTSNASGVYTLSNVATGTQSITAVATGYLAHTLQTTVTAGATSGLNIPISTGGKISVSVKNSAGAAVSGATVTMSGGRIATTVTGTTSSTGTLTTNWIPTGSYTVTVSMTGHTTQTKTATVSSGATTSLAFTAF
ncbi:MAG TPA: carboxypeptidase regulatory-like domain-containing protein [Candidatus Angelobacter sp.]|jgi:hypothetical protein|nr:carboxypeptidase regulatory-like domain-containing protein [Candidatus Angelobacter sp.]